MPVPGDFLGRLNVLLTNLGNASVPTTVVGIGVLVLIVVWNRLVPRVPGYIVALVAGTIVVAVGQLPVETIGSRFGGIPSGLPQVHIPRFRPDLILSLLSPTLTVAMLGAIESLLSAVVADRMSGRRHNSNVELFAQGIANIVSPMVGGLPATGAIARTATNVRSGGRTPVAGMIHACTLLLILLFAAKLAALVPMAVLGSILLVVAYNMGEWREIPELWKHGWTDRIVWVWTFALTVLADLTVAVEAGMIIAALMFIRRVTATTTVSRVTQDYVKRGREHILQDKDIPGYVTILRIHGPFLFGATDKLTAQTQAHRRLCADRRLAPSQHDRARWNRPARDSGFLRCAARNRPDLAALWRASAAIAADERGRIPSARRGGEHPSARRRRVEAGGRDLGDDGTTAAVAGAPAPPDG